MDRKKQNRTGVRAENAREIHASGLGKEQIRTCPRHDDDVPFARAPVTENKPPTSENA
jgi:hypothetical protein